MKSKLVGIAGRPYVDLDALISRDTLADVHEEICLGLLRVDLSYTGGSLKWLGVAAPWVQNDAFRDLGFTIEQLSDEQWLRFVSLAEDPSQFSLERRATYHFGDETEHPLTREQMLWLKYRHGVYFPWQVAYHFIENVRWEDNHDGAGKSFSEETCRIFPRTVAMIQTLPFTEIGRAVLFGLEANHHATLHRDSEPGRTLQINHSISICPAGNKRFYLCDSQGENYTAIQSRIYWFNDMDYHGVEPDPYFRYSIRIDGKFEPGFIRRLQR